MSINLPERIRKSAGLTSLNRGVPPKGERGVKFWASYTEAVQNHCNEHTGELLQCRTEYAILSKKCSELAGRLAATQEELNVLRAKLCREGIENAGQQLGLGYNERQQLVEKVS